MLFFPFFSVFLKNDFVMEVYKYKVLSGFFCRSVVLDSMEVAACVCHNACHILVLFFLCYFQKESEILGACY